MLESAAERKRDSAQHQDAERKRDSAQHQEMNPQIKGEKTIRYDFEIVDDQSGERLAAGYVTVVCVDSQFKSTPIPESIRNVTENA